MLNDDNVIFDSNEEHSLNGMEWSDFKVGKDISTYMEFWWNITEQAESNVSKIKALVITILLFCLILSIQMIY